MATRIDLCGKWQLTWSAMENIGGWVDCVDPIDASVPGDVHNDFVRAGILPEPLDNCNTLKHAWMEQARFTYRRTMSVPRDAAWDKAEIVFGGIDTLSTVFLDGKELGGTKNAFIPHAFDVTDLLKSGQEHEVTVDVDSGYHWANQQDLNYLTFSDSARVWLRKPQFTFGWDWSPRLVTCGLWRPVELKLYSGVKIRDCHLKHKISDSSAVLTADVATEILNPGDYKVHLQVSGPTGTFGTSAPITGESARVSVDVSPVALWFPRDVGEPVVYDVRVWVTSGEQELDTYQSIYGFRDVAIRQDPIRDGEKTFIVQINGRDVYCKGANWVPCDSLPGRITREKYEALVDLAAGANFNMLRIWGGGIYEDPSFYEACDRKGIMVWQDFMYVCAEYPDHLDWFSDAAREEAETVVTMLRDHPSIVIWCGNNENDWSVGIQLKNAGKPFRGEKIYAEILPDTCERFDGSRPYWQSSPFGGENPNSEEEGDVHFWGAGLDLKSYRGSKGKFISEYGLIALPNMATVKQFMPGAPVNTESASYKFHNNFFQGSQAYQWIDLLLGERSPELADIIFQSQICHSLGFQESIRWFRSRKFECAGVLFWMYNDCWGTSGWTIVDYYLRKKASYYAVKRAYEPLAIFLFPGDFVASSSKIVNDTNDALPAECSLTAYTFDAQFLVGRTLEVTVPANGAVDGPLLHYVGLPVGYLRGQIKVNGKLVAEEIRLPRIDGKEKLPPSAISATVKMISSTEAAITLKSDSLAWFTGFDLPADVEVDDNYFHLPPNEERTVILRGLNLPSEVELRAYNSERQMVALRSL